MSSANSSSLNNSSPSPADASVPPLLAAAFLIKFDLKVGYTITWKRNISGIELDGAVEFKSLPSGLHTVKDDLVYFIHEQYAGLSAFVNRPASESERNAHFVAVGVLVPLSYGRLGRSWLHAQKLQDLAGALVDDTTKTEALEEFWERYRQDKDSNNEQGDGSSEHRPSPSVTATGPKNHSRGRALSTLTNVLPSDQLLPSFHPALSIIQYLETFGPLIFPLHRAALLRKRILFMTSPPVRSSCEYVFDLSILSSIPVSIAELLSQGTEPLHRLRPYFSIGIHDIPFLEKEAAAAKANSNGTSGPDNEQDTNGPMGWVACSTDEIIALKHNLYDVIIELPATTENEPAQKQWPKMKTNGGTEVKATQRDLRRWKILNRELRKVLDEPYSEYQDDESDVDEDDEDETALLQRSRTLSTNEHQSNDEPDYDEKLIEPMSWSQLAYNGFMWWASAGEKDASMSEEADRDRQVLGDLSDFVPNTPHTPRSIGMEASQSFTPADAGIHTAVIAYFHRLTSVIVSTLAEIVDTEDDEHQPDEDTDNEDNELRGVFVGGDDIGRMGLDAWSESDNVFAREMLRMYFGREAVIRGPGIECCGLRIC